MFKKLFVAALAAVSMFAVAAPEVREQVQTVRGDFTITLYAPPNKVCAAFQRDVRVEGQGRVLQACATFNPDRLVWFVADEEGDVGIIPAQEFVSPEQVIVPPERNPRANPSTI